MRRHSPSAPEIAADDRRTGFTAGAAVGIPLALLSTRMVTSLSTLLFGLEPNDPPTIAVMTLLLVGLAAIAGYFPARRAARLDPVKALRNE